MFDVYCHFVAVKWLGAWRWQAILSPLAWRIRFVRYIAVCLVYWSFWCLRWLPLSGISGLIVVNWFSPGRWAVMFKSSHWETAPRWMPQPLNSDWSTLVQAMAWCCQGASHYLSQCLPRFMSPYGVARPQRVHDYNGQFLTWIINALVWC